MADDKLYNVYKFRIDSNEDPERVGVGLYWSDAEKLAWEIRNEDPLMDTYIIEADRDAGPFMKV